MTFLTAANLLAVSAQLLCVVAAAGALAAVLRINAAGVRFVYWRCVLALSLALPWAQRLAASASSRVSTADVSAQLATAAAPPAGPVSALTVPPWIPSGETILIIVLGGIAVRLAWMAAGLARLQRLRTMAATARRCQAHDDLAGLIDARADVRYVDTVSHPVTFGLFRPLVLLPVALEHQPADIQRAVLAHELIHVRRRDWAWVLAEEVVRAALWFHPAMWWLVSRVQLAREETVDALAVLATGKRRSYVEALLAFADDRPLAPATPFARRRHLIRRVSLIAREAAMSSTRIAVSLIAMLALLAVSGWYAVEAFPLRSAIQDGIGGNTPGPLEQKAQPITPENPIPRRATSVEPAPPAGSAGASARVTAVITLDEAGSVAEARVTRVETTWRGVTLVDEWAGEMWQGRLRPARVFRAAGTSEAQVDEARGLVAHMASAALDAVRRWSYEPPASAPLSFPVEVNVGRAVETTVAAAAQPIDEGAIRVGGPIKPPTRVRLVNAEYPPAAKDAKVEGAVVIQIRIEGDGRVSDARVVRSVPPLDQAAIDAVRQWEFTPTLMNGQPTPVIMTTVVNFTLQ